MKRGDQRGNYFSKVLYIVALYRKYPRVMTFWVFFVCVRGAHVTLNRGLFRNSCTYSDFLCVSGVITCEYFLFFCVCQGCTRVMSLYSHLCIKQKSSIENFFFLKSLYRGLLRNSCIYSDFFLCVSGVHDRCPSGRSGRDTKMWVLFRWMINNNFLCK